ncbi:MAG: hypothetical protein Tsb0032_21400 [Kiloniellaceae bacterium]
MTDWRLVAILPLLMIAGPAAAAEEELSILGPASGLESVEVYADAEAETLAGEVGPQSFPLPALAISDNMMIYIQAGGVEGWVFPFHIQANFDPGDIGPCNYNLTTGEAAPRAIGRNCKNAE